jgi:carboxymethylenebutenolidase
MELQVDWIRTSSGATELPMYVARPRPVQSALPAVIVIQEVWGVDEHIRDLVHRFAQAGYIAAAPDIYAHGGMRPTALAPDRVARVKQRLDQAPPGAWGDPAARAALFDELDEPERTRGLETANAVLERHKPIAQFVDDLAQAAAHLRTMPGCTGRVGSVGYCLGGMLSALLAGRDAELDAAAIYYGTSPEPAAMEGVRCPLIGFYGEEDTRITSGVQALGEALRAQGTPFEAHIYPNTPHAFFNDTRPSYRVDSARDAWARTLMFFDQHLAGGTD